jgi:ABC-type transport system involved in cytochrome bd biosynthesis fused ATPase/permease subunit
MFMPLICQCSYPWGLYVRVRVPFPVPVTVYVRDPIRYSAVSVSLSLFLAVFLSLYACVSVFLSVPMSMFYNRDNEHFPRV